MQKSRRGIIGQLVLVVALAAVTPARAAGPTDFTATFNPSFPATIQLRGWAPDDVARLRGVVLSLPGAELDTRNQTGNSSTQQRMRELGFAFVGLDDVNASYFGGSAADTTYNMQAMLTNAAAALGRPELANAPIFIFGISRGGMAASMIAQQFAPRVLGFYSDKGNWSPIPEFGQAQREVPGMMTFGSVDDVVTPSVVHDNFTSWGSNTHLSQAVEWGIGHVNSPDTLRNAYMDELIKARYPAGQLPPLTPNTPLVIPTLPLSSGWLAEVNEVNTSGQIEQIPFPTIAPANQYAGTQPTSWLPTQLMAQIYRAQNDRPVGIASNAFIFTASFSRTYSGGFDLKVSLTGVTYTSIDLYDANGRFAQLGYSPSVQQVVYPTVEGGLHKFVAVATYTFNGQTRFASKFVTMDTLGPSTSDFMGDFNHDRKTDQADLSEWASNLSRFEYGLRGDADGDSDVDHQDFLWWQQSVGTSFVSAAAAPEPSAGALAAASAAAMLRRRTSPISVRRPLARK